LIQQARSEDATEQLIQNDLVPERLHHLVSASCT